MRFGVTKRSKGSKIWRNQTKKLWKPKKDHNFLLYKLSRSMDLICGTCLRGGGQVVEIFVVPRKNKQGKKFGFV